MSKLDQVVAISNRIGHLQAELLDYTGHVRSDIGAAERKHLVGEVNNLRKKIGWPPLEMAGR